MNRFIKMILAASIIFTPAYIYLGLRLGNRMETWFLVAIPFLCVLALPLTFGWRSRERVRAGKWISFLAYIAMPLLSYLIVFSILRDFAILSTLSMSLDTAAFRLEGTYGLTSVMICTLLSLVVGYWRAVTGPSLRTVLIPIHDLPQALDGFIIAQVSDLHIGTTIGREYVERTAALVNKCQADIIALTGDIGDGNPEELRLSIEPLKHMQAKHGIFYAVGNHEYYWNLKSWVKAMEGIGARALLNEGQRVLAREAAIFIAGVTDAAATQVGDGEGPNWEKATRGMTDEKLKIFLKHRPGHPERAEKLGFHLQLSGHTHGGQLLPWTLVVRIVHRHATGLHRIGRLWLYVNPGTGSWGPLSRLGTTPEVTRIILQRDARLT